MTTTEVQALILRTLSRNLSILLADPSSVYKAVPNAGEGDTYVKLSELRAMHTACVANISQVIALETMKGK